MFCPKVQKHSFPDRHLKSQGSLQNFVFFFNLHFFCMLLIVPTFNSKPLSSCIATTPTPPHPPPQFGLLDFLELKHCGICWVLVQRDREQWTLSQGGHASRVLGTCMWGQGWPSVQVCVPGDRE